MERGERRRHPFLGDAIDHVADLKEGIESCGGREHCEGADAEEGEQQAPAYADAFKHGGNRKVWLAQPAKSAQIGLKRSTRPAVDYSSGTYSPPFQTYQIQL
ncbi:hypothetical protein [Rhizobium sp. N113]|uniref:hypothetical protein n=1 Tax=Rhizobium sp. N113 TaxID=1703960 RepID=UPI001F2A674B|nr:hypothetical protein [Rhizobium sp. N113]